jgi:hypothetical protein
MGNTSRAVASPQGTIGQPRPEHGRGPPKQIDVDRYRRSAAVLCYMTPTTEEKYDNGPGPKLIEGRYAQHSSTRKVAAAFPKSSDASPITSLANKQGKQTTKTLNLALHHRASGRFADPRFAARE